MNCETKRQIKLNLRSRKNVSIIVIVAIVFWFIVLHFFIPSVVGAVGGSFGLRPVSHGCIGLIVSQEKIGWLFPDGDIEFKFPFHFRYFVSSEFQDRIYCLGQDIWYGE